MASALPSVQEHIVDIQRRRIGDAADNRQHRRGDALPETLAEQRHHGLDTTPEPHKLVMVRDSLVVQLHSFLLHPLRHEILQFLLRQRQEP